MKSVSYSWSKGQNIQLFTIKYDASISFMVWCIGIMDFHTVNQPCIPGIIPLDHSAKYILYVAGFHL